MVLLRRMDGVTDITALAAPGGASGSDAQAERMRLGRAELLGIFAFWTFMAVLSAANALLDPRGGRGLQPNVASAPIALAFVESYLWAAATLLVFRLTSRYSVERSSWLSRVLLFVGLGVVLSICVDVITAYLRFNVFFTPRRLPPSGSLPGPLLGIVRLWFLNEMIVYAAVLAAGFARVYFLHFQSRQEETVRLQAQAAQLHAQLAEARLATLRTQLDPHFLFNTLHAVSALVERDPRGVRRMISRLSELLRQSLEGAQEQEVPLEREMGLVEKYLEIMQIRFQGTLELSVRMDAGAADALVPSLVLQPLVENAIKHGVGRIRGTGRIEITADHEGGRVVLRVRDNGPGPGGGEAAREGVGLGNTRARLEQLYGADGRLALRAAESGGTLAEVSLPFHTRAVLRASAVGAAAEGSRA
jgi:two-component system LytT family sensor kinase